MRSHGNIEMTSDLIARLEKATGPDRELDEAIAIAIGLWKPWLSKHRRWNFNGPKHFEWPENRIPEYDSEFGKKIILTETPWSGWADKADLPYWTGSIDAALMLVPEGSFELGFTHTWWASIGQDPPCTGASAALALCIAVMKAREHGKT